MAAEVERWATVQKSEFGFEMLDSTMKRSMRARGISPDMWILPPGMMHYVSMRRENSSYLLRGPASQDFLKGALNGAPGSQVAATNDCQVRKLRFLTIPSPHRERLFYQKATAF